MIQPATTDNFDAYIDMLGPCTEEELFGDDDVNQKEDSDESQL
jgi:hypothetical protein